MFQSDAFNEVSTLYLEEGIDVFDFSTVDNSETLHLLEGRHGLIVALNEECMLPKGNDVAFVSKAKKRNSGSRKMINKKLHLPHEFEVEHFAGLVRYDARRFVQTNMDKLPENLLQCAAKSTNSLIREEFLKIIASREVLEEGSKPSNRKKKTDNKSILQQFQGQLKDLIGAIEGTRTRYIRCIKANALMIPKLTDHGTTMKQLECSGLMTALIISKETFPQKLTYDFILSRYACLMQSDRLKDAVVGMEPQEKVKYVLIKWLKPISTKNRDGTRTMPFACGKTRVFFKPGAQDRLEQLRRQYYERSSRTIQSWFRRISAVKLLVTRRQSMYTIQSFSRMALAKLRFERQKTASTCICAWIRCRWAVLAFHLKKDGAITIQCHARRWKEENGYRKMKTSALLIQATFRVVIARLQTQRLKAAYSTINVWLYSCVFRRKLKHAKAAAKIQTAWHHHQSWRRMTSNGQLQQDEASHTDAKPLSDKDNAVDSDDDSDAISSSYSTLRSFSATSAPSAKVDSNDQGEPRAITIEESNDDETDTRQKMQENNDVEQLRLAQIEQMQVTFKRRIADLTKANDGLVREVFKLRQECSEAKKLERMTAVQMGSQLAVAREDNERISRRHQNKIESLQRRLHENEERHVEEKKAKSRDIHVVEAKYNESIATLREELKKTQDSHQHYLTKLMTVLETTQSMRENETAKISAELRAIKKEKDNQILMLRQELKAARAAKGIIVHSVESETMINSRRLKDELLADADGIAECSQQFNDKVEELTNLITSTHALPPVVGPHNMAEVLEQQENAQRMMELIGDLMDVYNIGEQRQTSKNENALAAVNDYIAVSEPDEAIRDLRERLSQVELENARMRHELKEKEHCRKCAIREEAARRRMERSEY